MYSIVYFFHKILNLRGVFQIIVGADYFDNNLNYWRFAAKKKLEAWKGTDPSAIHRFDEKHYKRKK